MVPSYTLEWVSRDGRSAAATGPSIEELYPWVAVSPDASRVVYVAGRAQPGIFVRDLATGADTRLTSEAVKGFNVALGGVAMMTNPAWFPSGDRVLYTTGQIEASQVMAGRGDGSGEPSALVKGSYGRVSADGKLLLWIEDIAASAGCGMRRSTAIRRSVTHGRHQAWRN